MLVDGGIFDYDLWHPYAIKTQSHNTITVDNTSQSAASTYATKEWVTNNGFDFVDGWVNSSVTHDRKIFFVRNEYWIVSDLLTGSGSHTYDQYWHLPAISWTNVPTLDAASKKVTSTGNGLMIIPADPATLTASLIDDYVNNQFTRSKTVKYTKSGNVPASFDTVIYPYPGTVPAIAVARQSAKRGATNLASTTASGLSINIGANNDYYFIAHDGSSTATDYGVFQYNGDAAYIRKNGSGAVTNIQIKNGTDLKENGINLATTFGVKAHINAANNTVEISKPTSSGPAVTNFNIWSPNTVSVKIDGVSVGFIQNGNYVASETSTPTSTPTPILTLIPTPTPTSIPTLTPTPTPTPTQVSNLVGYWKFDETSGTSAADSAGTNTGTINGATRTAGKINNALNFNGSSNYVSVPTGANFNFPNTLTLEAWIKPAVPLGSLNIIGKKEWGVTTSGYYLMLEDGYLVFNAGNGTTYLESLSNPLSWTANTWYHVAVTFSSGTVNLYRNGVSVGSGTNISQIANNPQNLFIGSTKLTTYPFNGAIDEVKIYSRALSASEVLADYTAGIVTPTPTPF